MLDRTSRAHYPHNNDEGYDVTFIDAAFYDREEACQPTSLAQRPTTGETIIEAFASKDVPVLAYPVLYCQTHDAEHPCKYQHINERFADMGDCEDGLYHSKYAPQSYKEATRVPTVVSKTYTGRMERKA